MAGPVFLVSATISQREVWKVVKVVSWLETSGKETEHNGRMAGIPSPNSRRPRGSPWTAHSVAEGFQVGASLTWADGSPSDSICQS